MTEYDLSEDARVGPALQRVLSRAGGPDLLDLLVTELSGADLTTLLLEVFRRRADRLTPAEVMRRYHSDRFVAPARIDPAVLRRAEDVLFAALPEGFESLALAPLVPLATHSAVGSVDPRKVVATIRASEVAADPTNGLALEAAHRRSALLAADPRSSAPVRLAATQRVVRAQHFGAPGMLAHFQLLGAVTAGRDTGDLAFERRHLVEHLQFGAGVLSAAGIEHAEIRLTCMDEESIALLEHTRVALAAAPGIDVLDDPERASGRGYYTRLCYKIHATIAGESVELADGGFVEWTQQLTGNRKERLLISGFGVDRLAASLPPRTGEGERAAG